MNRTRWRPRRPLWDGSARSLFLVTLLAALLLPSVSVAQRSVDAVAVQNAVVAPRLGLAFVMKTGGGIEALDLASGAVRWRSDKAARPLALAGDRLVAQAEPGSAGSLALVLLDTRNGAARSSTRVPIDAAVTATALGGTRAGTRGAEALAFGERQ